MVQAREVVSFYHVDKVYPPKQTALRNIDVKIRQGEFVFIAGSSGAGKSTFLKLIFAEERSNRGQIIVGGLNLQTASRAATLRLRRNMGVIFQDYRLLYTRTVIENVAFSLEVLGVRKKARFERAAQLLDAVGLGHRKNAYPAMLSGGEQQRIAIARALINRPQIILADEPTGNLDPDLTQAIFSLLIEASKLGSTVIVASHNLGLIEQLNQRTLVLDQGCLIGDFSTPGG